MQSGQTIIIGAGPAGLSAAYDLARRGRECLVLESDECVGGLARSLDLWGRKVDLGPHRFFSANERVNRLWLDVVQDDFRMVDRLTRIYYDKHLLKYPLDFFDVIGKLGTWESLRCTWSYFLSLFGRDATANAPDFETWVVGRFGRRLYEMVFKSYSEKLWGIDCTELDADFARQRIKNFSLGEALKGFVGSRNSRHATLVDRFAYPVEGSGVVYERMARAVKDHGGEVLLSSPVAELRHEDGRIRQCVLRDGRAIDCEHAISSMPLTHLLRALNPAPPAEVLATADKLRFRSTILVYLEIEGAGHFADQWLFIHDPTVRVGRITNFRNWPTTAASESPSTILSLEYWCTRGDADWSRTDDAWADLAAGELEQLGLAGKSRVLNRFVYRIPYCYPIYALGYRESLVPVIRYLRGFENLQAIGRYGSFKYNNQDHSLLMGLLAAENVAEGTAHDLWEINTDTVYQESGPALTRTREQRD